MFANFVRHAGRRSYATKALDPAQIEKVSEKILRVVEKRMLERQEALVEKGSLATDVKRSKQLKQSAPLQEAWDEWNTTKQLINETAPLLKDEDPAMRSLALEEYTSLTSTLEALATTTFPTLLVPKSETEHMGALIELKAGVGGGESTLFVQDLVRMYVRLVNTMGKEARWKATVSNGSESDSGGNKDASIEVKGRGSYDALRWESGVHRVQRVPATESGGRVHTSTVAVVVLPLADENAPMDEELFKMEDVRIEVMRSRGAGGQHVNTTESAVRLTHVPTGVTVSMQDERSQHQNRRKAFTVLAARLMDQKITRAVTERRDSRRSLVTSADRSEKIRTYNYPQDRVTDHRVGLSLMNLQSVMEGDAMLTIVDALKTHHDENVLEDMLA